MSAARPDAPPESDRLGAAPHPRETSEFFGHAQAEAALLEAYRSARLPQAWIIGGRRGIGKATLAWRFARFLAAHPDPRHANVAAARDLRVAPSHPVARHVASLSHPDLLVLRRQWNDRNKKHFTEIRVDDVRRAAHLFQQASGAEGYRVCILDSADDLNRSAANALLKLIEEPPPRSLFLIVAHRPGRVIATIRSRSRMLLLQPLGPEDLGRAVAATGIAADAAPDVVRTATLRAGGSVADALGLLDGNAARLLDRLATMLGRLPEVDWHDVHHLADTVASREATNEYQGVLAAILDWLDGTVAQRAGEGARRLAPYAQVWEKLGAAARETEAFNLDKHPLIFALFAELAAATRASRG